MNRILLAFQIYIEKAVNWYLISFKNDNNSNKRNLYKKNEQKNIGEMKDRRRAK